MGGPPGGSSWGFPLRAGCPCGIPLWFTLRVPLGDFLGGYPSGSLLRDSLELPPDVLVPRGITLCVCVEAAPVSFAFVSSFTWSPMVAALRAFATLASSKVLGRDPPGKSLKGSPGGILFAPPGGSPHGDVREDVPGDSRGFPLDIPCGGSPRGMDPPRSLTGRAISIHWRDLSPGGVPAYSDQTLCFILRLSQTQLMVAKKNRGRNRDAHAMDPPLAAPRTPSFSLGNLVQVLPVHFSIRLHCAQYVTCAAPVRYG